MPDTLKFTDLETVKTASRSFGARDFLRHLQASPNLTTLEKVRIQAEAKGYFAGKERGR